MLSNCEKVLLYNTLQAIIARLGPVVDTRLLIHQAIHNLALAIPSLNAHHAAGMLAALKRAGFTFTVIVPGRQTEISI